MVTSLFQEFLSPLLGYLAGIVSTFLATLGVYLKRRRDIKRKLRKALRAEIESFSGILKKADSGLDTPLSPGHISKTVYNANAAELGRLSDEEVEHITRYYSAITGLENDLELYRQYGSDNPQVKATIKEKMVAVQRNKLRALEVINKALDDREQQYDLAEWMDSADRDILHQLALATDGVTSRQIASNTSLSANVIEERLAALEENTIVLTKEEDDETHYYLTKAGSMYMTDEIQLSEIQQMADFLKGVELSLEQATTAPSSDEADPVDSKLILNGIRGIGEPAALDELVRIVPGSASDIRPEIERLEQNGILTEEADGYSIADDD